MNDGQADLIGSAFARLWPKPGSGPAWAALVPGRDPAADLS